AHKEDAALNNQRDNHAVIVPVDSFLAFACPRFLLPDRKVDPLQNRAGFITDFDVPRSLCISRHLFAAPASPGRSADRECDIADLIVTVKPDVVQRLAVAARDAHPEHDRPDAIGKTGAAILWRPVGGGARQNRCDVGGGRGRGCRRRRRLLRGVLCSERSCNTQREDRYEQRFHADTPWLRFARSAARRLRRSNDAPSTAAMRQPNTVPANWKPS